MNKTKVFFSFFSSVIVLSFFVLPVSAAQFKAGSQYVLDQGKILGENLYAAGSNIVVNGTVGGDVMVVGQAVNIFGKVSNDVTAAGNNLNVMGEVGDDLRIVGTLINVGGTVGGETLAAGNEINISKNANLAGAVRLAGKTIDIEGDIYGPAKIKGEKVVFNGRAAQDIEITAAKELVIGSNAVIGGKLTYKSPKPATIESGAQLFQKPEYQLLEAGRKGAEKGILWGIFTIFFLGKLIVMILSALAVCWLFRKWTETFVKETVANFGREAIRGFIFLVVTPAAIIGSFMTVIASFFGLITALCYAAALITAGIFSGILVGGWLSKYLYKQSGYTIDWKAVSLGVLVVFLLGLIPVVGWLIDFIIFLAAFGSLLNFGYRHLWLARE